MLLLENNEFLQFYLQKYLDSFSFKKVIFTNHLNDITLFAKEILIKKKNKDLNSLKNTFNPILIKEKEFILKNIFRQFY